MNPGYFALVMATGIISIAAYQLGMIWVADLLFLISNAAYLILVVLIITRSILSPRSLSKGIALYDEGPSFFAIVAGTCVLGSAYVSVEESMAAGFILWIVGIVLWLVLSYSFFTSIIIRVSKPSFENTINASWLLFVVATQAVSILGTMVSSLFPSFEDILLFAMLSTYFVGVMFYIVLITTIMYRLFFFNFTPDKFTPLYWVAMGAAAITTLSGTTLISASEKWAFLAEILPFLKGLSLFFWAFTTWWITLLIALTIWKHIIERLPLEYDVEYWGMVFPLGMYTFCTHQVAKITATEFISPVSSFFIYIALATWAATFIGLVGRFIQVFFIRKLH